MTVGTTRRVGEAGAGTLRAGVTVPAMGAGAARRYGWGYFLFMLVTVTLYVRPSELMPALGVLPLFQVLIVSCAVVSAGALVDLLRWRSLRERPGVLCVMGMVPAIMLSRVADADFTAAEMGAVEFLKVLTYFVLLLALVNTPKRLRELLLVVVGCILVTTVFATLRYHGIIADPTGRAMLVRGDGGIDILTGEGIVFSQLQAVGIFSDPNDFALVLVTAILAVIFFMTRARWGARLLWLVPLGMLGYAFALTRSRGGMLSLLAGLVTWTVARYGAKRASLLLVVVLPMLLVVLGGRQTNINLDASDTAQSRLRLWREGIGFMKESPLFGVGYNTYADRADNVAHNSYLHCYAELGVVGGTFFVGAWLLPMLATLGPSSRRRLAAVGACLLPGQPTDARGIKEVGEELRGLRCCVLATGAAYAVGIFSLSRSYTCSTYVVVGMLGAMAGIMAAQNPATAIRVSWRTAWVLGIVSVMSAGFLWLFVRLVLRVG